MELPVSLPSPTSPRLAAIAAAVPPLDPAVTRSRRVGIFRVAGQDGTDGFIGAESPFGHVGFGEDEGAGVLDVLHLKSVLIGNEFREGERAVGGPEALGFEIILDDHRDAVERAGQAGLCEAAVQIVGLLFDVGVDQDDGVDRRAILIVGVDALQVLRDESAAGEFAGLHRVVDLRDSSLLDFELRLSEERNR